MDPDPHGFPDSMPPGMRSMMESMMERMGGPGSSFNQVPPGHEGYDFISGHDEEATADKVKALPQTNEWWLVTNHELASPMAPFARGTDEDDDDDDDDDDVVCGARVRFLDLFAEGGGKVSGDQPVASVKLSFIATQTMADYRARSLPGLCELLYRTLLSACHRPMANPMGLPGVLPNGCLLYTSPSPRDQRGSRMPSSA